MDGWKMKCPLGMASLGGGGYVSSWESLSCVFLFKPVWDDGFLSYLDYEGGMVFPSFFSTYPDCEGVGFRFLRSVIRV